MAKPPRSLTELDSLIDETGAFSKEIGTDPVIATGTNNAEEQPKKSFGKKKDIESYTFQMVGDFKRDPDNGTIRYPSMSLSNSQLVYEEETGKTRMARLLRGIPTMWQDEQDKLTDKFVSRNAVSMVFNSGKLIIPAQDELTWKYLMLCSDFEGCKRPAVNRKTRYRLLDTEGIEAKEMERKQKQRDAIELAWKSPMDDLIVHYSYLGGQLKNDHGEDKTENGLRTDYVKRAEEQPDLFLKTISNPIVKMHMLVKNAIEKTQIVYIDQQYIWASTKSYICQVPKSYEDKPANYLAE
jgi:hypothetical protein